MPTLDDYISKFGISRIVNDYGEVVCSTRHKVIFRNGWCASIVHRENHYTVAAVDYNGRFDWSVLKNRDTGYSPMVCEDIGSVISACETIRHLAQ